MSGTFKAKTFLKALCSRQVCSSNRMECQSTMQHTYTKKHFCVAHTHTKKETERKNKNKTTTTTTVPVILWTAHRRTQCQRHEQTRWSCQWCPADPAWQAGRWRAACSAAQHASSASVYGDCTRPSGNATCRPAHGGEGCGRHSSRRCKCWVWPGRVVRDLVRKGRQVGRWSNRWTDRHGDSKIPFNFAMVGVGYHEALCQLLLWQQSSQHLLWSIYDTMNLTNYKPQTQWQSSGTKSTLFPPHKWMLIHAKQLTNATK